jgi:hypothetical protein
MVQNELLQTFELKFHSHRFLEIHRIRTNPREETTSTARGKPRQIECQLKSKLRPYLKWSAKTRTPSKRKTTPFQCFGTQEICDSCDPFRSLFNDSSWSGSIQQPESSSSLPSSAIVPGIHNSIDPGLSRLRKRLSAEAADSFRI